MNVEFALSMLSTSPSEPAKIPPFNRYAEKKAQTVRRRIMEALQLLPPSKAKRAEISEYFASFERRSLMENKAACSMQAPLLEGIWNVRPLIFGDW